MKVVIAAAGTGGHINPGIAIANKIKEEQTNSQVIFIGTIRGLETNLVPRAGYELETIDSYGISRELSIKNIKRFIKTLHSIKQAEKILKEFKPDLVIGTGGYICISVCMAAKKLDIPYIIHESNVLPGIATKLLSGKAKKILVGFEEAKTKLPEANNIVYTGTPTKVKKINLKKEEIKNKKGKLGFTEDKPLVLVFGGSQGAQSINKSMTDIIINRMNNNYQIIWSAGPEQYEIVKQELKKEKIDIEKLVGIKVMPYIYNMEEIMNIVDLIVARSGAMTVTEIENVGKPAIFIPFPYAAENHQEYNARALEQKEAAKVILDKNLTAEVLNATIIELSKDRKKLERMGENAHKMSTQNVEDKIYKELIK